MNCSEFLELYSDYRDGCLENANVARAVREHLGECEACMRYDAAVCRGVMALRSTDELEPSRSVAFRGINVLPDSGDTVSPIPAKFAGALMVAAAIALLVWSHSEQPEGPPAIAQTLPAPAARATALPEPKPLPVREIDPPTRIFHAQLQPPPEQAPIAEWVALPE
jgi:hypothetical protein